MYIKVYCINFGIFNILWLKCKNNKIYAYTSVMKVTFVILVFTGNVCLIHFCLISTKICLLVKTGIITYTHNDEYIF